MNPRMQPLAILSVAGLISLPAIGATVIKERRVTETKGEGTTTEVVETVIDGGKARISVTGGDNPMLGGGSYMLIRDNAFFIVNPSERTYIRMDEAEMQAMAAQGRQSREQQREATEAQGVGAGEKTLKSFEFKPLVDEEGPVMLGLPTRHYKFQLKYKTSETMPGAPMGMTMDESVERLEEFWATTAVDLQGPQVFDSAQSFMGGEEDGRDQPAQVAEAETTMATKGLRLKSTVEFKESAGMGGAMGMMARMSSMGMAGGSDTTAGRTTTEVLELRKMSAPAGTFELPAGYAETSMMGPGAGMPDLNRLQQ